MNSLLHSQWWCWNLSPGFGIFAFRILFYSRWGESLTHNLERVGFVLADTNETEVGQCSGGAWGLDEGVYLRTGGLMFSPLLLGSPIAGILLSYKIGSSLWFFSRYREAGQSGIHSANLGPHQHKFPYPPVGVGQALILGVWMGITVSCHLSVFQDSDSWKPVS